MARKSCGGEHRYVHGGLRGLLVEQAGGWEGWQNGVREDQGGGSDRFGCGIWRKTVVEAEDGPENEQGQSEVGVQDLRGRPAREGAQGESGAAHSVPGAVVDGQPRVGQARTVAQVQGSGGRQWRHTTRARRRRLTP